MAFHCAEYYNSLSKKKIITTLPAGITVAKDFIDRTLIQEDL
jgi:hypothetical protein